MRVEAPRKVKWRLTLAPFSRQPVTAIRIPAENQATRYVPTTSHIYVDESRHLRSKAFEARTQQTTSYVCTPGSLRLSAMNNDQFRKLVFSSSKGTNSNDGASSTPGRTGQLGSRQRANIPMTPQVMRTFLLFTELLANTI